MSTRNYQIKVLPTKLIDWMCLLSVKPTADLSQIGYSVTGVIYDANRCYKLDMLGKRVN